MASQTVLALAALVCLAAIAIAHPLDDDVQVLMRERRAAARRGAMAYAGYAAHTQNDPAYASPEQDAEEEEELKPQRPVRARPTRPARPQVQSEEEDEEEDDGPPSSQGSAGGGKGATAIANAYSRGNGASSNSHATAYGGRFSGGMFKHSYGK